MAWFAPAAQAASGLATGVLNFFGQKRRQLDEFRHNINMSNRAYKQDLNMWNKQNEYNLKLWNLQNEYNLPRNQVQRLKDAGLNPNLLAGNASAGGTAAAVQKGDTPRYQAPRANFNYTPLKTPDVLGMYQNFRLADAQIDNVKAQEELTKEKALTEAALRVHKKDDAFARATTNYVTAKYSEHMKELEVNERKEALNKLRQEAGLKKYELQWMKDFGMRPGDPLHYRWLMRLLEQFGPSFAR